MNTHSPIGRPSTTVTEATIARSERLEQTAAQREAQARAVAELFDATKQHLGALTLSYGRQVGAALVEYGRVWRSYAQTNGPTSDYDAATNSKFRPQFLGEAIARQLVASGVNLKSASMQRGARQARRRRA